MMHGAPIATPPVYAGFWRRFNAYGIDATIVAILVWLLDAFLLTPAFAQIDGDLMQQLEQINRMTAALQSGQITPEMSAMAKQSLIDSALGGSILGLDTSLLIAVSAVYNILFVVGRWHATPGKHWLGMKVLRADGAPLTPWQSILRHGFSGLSMLPLGLGCITIGFTREKTAPHDMMCGSRVVRTSR